MINTIIYKNKSLNQLSVKDIFNQYKDKGIIIFRSFKLDNFKVKKFVDKFTLKYSNDAGRRKK